MDEKDLEIINKIDGCKTCKAVNRRDFLKAILAHVNAKRKKLGLAI